MDAVAGQIHHIELNVSSLGRSTEFWGWLLGLLDYKEGQRWEKGTEFRFASSYIVLVQAAKENLDVPFFRRRVGLHHIAFHATKMQIAEIKSQLVAKGVTIVKDWTQTLGRPHAIYFLDPDGIEIELAAT